MCMLNVKTPASLHKKIFTKRSNSSKHVSLQASNVEEFTQQEKLNEDDVESELLK